MEQQQDRHSQALKAATTTLPTANLSALKTPGLAQKTYHGRWGRAGSPEVWIEEVRGPPTRRRDSTTVRPLPLHLEVCNHSPTGFAWGYGGSGPAQLALALLIDATGDEEVARQHYQEFKRRFVAAWGQVWSITAREIRTFVTSQER